MTICGSWFLRARTVKEAIVKTEKVEANRVFLLEPKS